MKKHSKIEDSSMAQMKKMTSQIPLKKPVKKAQNPKTPPSPKPKKSTKNSKSGPASNERPKPQMDPQGCQKGPKWCLKTSLRASNSK